MLSLHAALERLRLPLLMLCRYTMQGDTACGCVHYILVVHHMPIHMSPMQVKYAMRTPLFQVWGEGLGQLYLAHLYGIAFLWAALSIRL